MDKEALGQTTAQLMAAEAQVIDVVTKDPGWGFAISFVGGHGVLTTKERMVGPLCVKTMSLEVPNLTFPFDLSGGAEIFRSRRCMLRNLVLTLDNARLQDIVNDADLAGHGFYDTKIAICDGFIELAGSFRVGEHAADFTCRAALLPSAPHTLQLVFYDTRLFGWMPVAAGLLPVCLQRAFHIEAAGPAPAGTWTLRPVETFARQVLPRGGWKIPDLRKSHLINVALCRNELAIAAGPGEQAWETPLAERPVPPAAIRAARGILAFQNAEIALAQGAVGEAYERFRRGADDPQDGAWARERLLQIGAADPELVLETRRLAEEVLAHNPEDVAARLALGALSLQGRAFDEAIEHYGALAELCTARKERFDVLACDMATGRAAAFEHPPAALRAFERAASRADDSPTVQAHIYALHESTGAYAQAAETGERWVGLVGERLARASTHCRLASLYLSKLNDSSKARQHYNQALREAPNLPEALEGLAEVHIARHEPTEAAAFLEQMAQQAEHSDDVGRIATLNLRLGEVACRLLHNPKEARQRFARVIEVEPRHVLARLRLGELCEADDDWVQAIELYRGVVLVQDDMVGGDAKHLLEAHLRLAALYARGEGDKSAQVIAQLERVLEIDPTCAAARQQLLEMLRRSGDFAQLVLRLEELVRLDKDAVRVRAARIEAAAVEVHKRDHLLAARCHLEPLLDEEPAALDALELFTDICKRQGDFGALAARLSKALGSVPRTQAKNRATLMFALAMAQKAQALDPSLCRQSLEAVLLLDPEHAAAAHMLVALLEHMGDVPALARAYKSLAATQPDAQQRASSLLQAARALAKLPEQTGPALAAAQAALQAQPTLRAAYLLQAELLAPLDLEGAIATLAGGLPHFVDDEAVPLHEALAQLYGEAQNFAAQAQHLQAVMDAGALQLSQHRAFVDALVQLGQQDRAAVLWEHLAEAQPEQQGAYLLQAAQLHGEAGQVEAAETLLERVAALGGPVALSAGSQLEAMARAQGDVQAVVRALHMQIKHAKAAARLGPQVRLLQWHLEQGVTDAAAQVAEEILAAAPQHALARHTMAEACRRAGLWEEALDHYVFLTLVADKEALAAPVRQAAFHAAAALASEVRHNALPALQQSYLNEFGMPLQALPMGELLAADGAFESLLSLRLVQLKASDSAAEPQLRRQIGDLLHHRLGRGGEAEPHYVAYSLAAPQDVEVRLALADIFEAQGRHQDLAHALLALCPIVQQPALAVNHALKACALFSELLKNEAAAGEALQAALRREDVRALVIASLCGAQKDATVRCLPMLLRKLGMYPSLSHLLESSLEQTPTLGDGRFEELFTLLRGPLREPGRALRWTQLMLGRHPDDDGLRRKQLALLKEHGAQGTLENMQDASAEARAAALQAQAEALQQWAQARNAASRARILQELFALRRSMGDTDAASAALAAAIEAHPEPEPLYAEIIEHNETSQRWTEAMLWLWRATRLPGHHDAARVAQNDVRLLRIVEIATDRRPDSTMVRAALAAMSKRTAEQFAVLLRLSCADGDYRDLLAPSVVQQCTGKQLTEAAHALLMAQSLPGAKVVLQAIISRHEGPGGENAAAWELAEKGWRRHHALEELAQWRLEAAERTHAGEARRLRLLAYAELIEAKAPPANVAALTHGVLVDVDFAVIGEALAAFSAAAAIQADGFIDKAARALEHVLDIDAPLARAVLLIRVQAELDHGEASAAVQVARRLVEAGDPSGGAWLQTALDKAGQRAELIDLLTQRAAVAEDDAPELWTRIAALQVAEKDFLAASRALAKVLPEARTKPFGELQYEVGAALGDGCMEALGCQLCAQYSFNPQQRAHWLRRAARVSWHRLSDCAAALQLLREAHGLQPADGQTSLAQAEGLLMQDDPSSAAVVEAICALQDDLVVMAASEAASLWRCLGALLMRTGRANETYVKALPYLTIAAHLAVDKPSELLRLVDLCQASSLHDLRLQCFVQLYAVAPKEHFGALVAALAQGGHHRQWHALLLKHVHLVEGNEAANLLDTAATLCEDHLGEMAQARTLWQRSAEHAPSVERVRRIIALSQRAGDAAAVAQAATQLVQLCALDAPARADALRTLLAAQTSLDDAAGQTHSRRALVEAGWATMADKQALAVAIEHDDAALALRLWDEVAEAIAGSGAAGAQRAQWAAALFCAAQACARLHKPEAAAARLRLALAAGLDSLAAYTLAMRVFDEAGRIPIAGRFLTLQGDAAWEPERRSATRLELARAKAQGGELAAARLLVQQARAFHPAPAVTAFLEDLLQRQNDQAALLQLYLEEAATVGLDHDILMTYLQRAATLARSLHKPADELLALDRLAELSQAAAGHQKLVAAPELVRMLELCASLGENERFFALLARGQRHAEDIAQLARQATPWCLRLPDGGPQALLAAQKLLEEALCHTDDADLLGALEDVFAQQSIPGAFAPYLEARARRQAASGIIDWDMLRRAAELFQRHNDAGRAFALCHEIQAATGTLSDAAMRFCIRFAVQQQQYDEAVTMLTHQAEHTGDAGASHEMLLVAASIVREKLGDQDRELSLLHAAYVQSPHPDLLLRLVQAYLECQQDAVAARLLDNLPLHAYPEAVPAYEAVLQRARTSMSAQACHELVSHYRRQGAHEALAQLCECLADMAPAHQPGLAQRRVHLLEAARLYGECLGNFSHAAQLFEQAGELRLAQEALIAALSTADLTGQARVGAAKQCGMLAWRQHDAQTASTYLFEAYRLDPQDAACCRQLAQALEAAQRFHELCELYASEATLASKAGDTASEHAYWTRLADLYQDKLHAPRQARKALERASEARPGDGATLERLLQIYEREGERSRYLLTAERLLSLPRKQMRSAAFYKKLAQVYSQVDPARAKTFLQKAAAAPVASAPPTPASCASEAAADVGAEELHSLQAHLDADPDNLELLRRVADVHALDEARWPQATALYGRLLRANPEDGEVLRLVARLHGQQGDTERAFSHYACLLYVAPADREATHFVDSCRASRSMQIPQATQFAPQAYGRLFAQVAHPDLSGPVEDLFAPLARYIELAHPANPLRDKELQRQTLVAPKQSRLQPLLPLLGLGLTPAVQLRVWGARLACDMHLAAASPTVLVGHTLLAENAPEQAHAAHFSLARTIELHRSGHTLCARLPATTLHALGLALCAAVGDGVPPQQRDGRPAGPEVRQWAARIVPLLSAHIRTSMASQSAAYGAEVQEDDVQRWALASLCTANRLAMLLWCDVQAATAALADGPLPRRLDKSSGNKLLRSQITDLLRFAQSDLYFNLRQNLGLTSPLAVSDAPQP